MNPSQLFETFVSLGLQVTLVVLVTVVLERRISDPRMGCQLWTFCFVGILGLTAAAILFPHYRLLRFNAALSADAVMTTYRWQTSAVKPMLTIWACGCVWILIVRSIRFRSLTQFLKQKCQPLTDAEIRRLPVPNGASLPSDLRWLASDDIQGPFCWQLQRPTIVVPRLLLSETGDTLRHVLQHELEHLRTNHPLQHFLQGVCTTMYWFHPLVWWAACRTELSREFLCDEVAAKTSGRVADYLRTLAKVAEQSVHAPPGTLAFGRRKSAIVLRSERLLRIAQWPQHDCPRNHRRFTLVSLGLLVLVTSQVWLPINVFASSRSPVSPWPSWTAKVLHDCGVCVRDFEQFDGRFELQDVVAKGE